MLTTTEERAHRRKSSLVLRMLRRFKPDDLPEATCSEASPVASPVKRPAKQNTGSPREVPGMVKRMRNLFEHRTCGSPSKPGVPARGSVTSNMCPTSAPTVTTSQFIEYKDPQVAEVSLTAFTSNPVSKRSPSQTPAMRQVESPSFPGTAAQAQTPLTAQSSSSTVRLPELPDHSCGSTCDLHLTLDASSEDVGIVTFSSSQQGNSAARNRVSVVDVKPVKTRRHSRTASVSDSQSTASQQRTGSRSERRTATHQRQSSLPKATGSSKTTKSRTPSMSSTPFMSNSRPTKPSKTGSTVEQTVSVSPISPRQVYRLRSLQADSPRAPRHPSASSPFSDLQTSSYSFPETPTTARLSARLQQAAVSGSPLTHHPVTSTNTTTELLDSQSSFQTIHTPRPSSAPEASDPKKSTSRVASRKVSLDAAADKASMSKTGPASHRRSASGSSASIASTSTPTAGKAASSKLTKSHHGRSASGTVPKQNSRTSGGKREQQQTPPTPQGPGAKSNAVKKDVPSRTASPGLMCAELSNGNSELPEITMPPSDECAHHAAQKQSPQVTDIANQDELLAASKAMAALEAAARDLKEDGPFAGLACSKEVAYASELLSNNWTSPRPPAKPLTHTPSSQRATEFISQDFISPSCSPRHIPDSPTTTRYYTPATPFSGTQGSPAPTAPTTPFVSPLKIRTNSLWRRSPAASPKHLRTSTRRGVLYCGGSPSPLGPTDRRLPCNSPGIADRIAQLQQYMSMSRTPRTPCQDNCPDMGVADRYTPVATTLMLKELRELETAASALSLEGTEGMILREAAPIYSDGYATGTPTYLKAHIAGSAGWGSETPLSASACTPSPRRILLKDYMSSIMK